MSTNLDIPHGGWIPKGRMTENGPLPDKYKLQEMPTSSYPKRTEQNVIEVQIFFSPKTIEFLRQDNPD